MVEINLFHYTERDTFFHRIHPMIKICSLLLSSLLIAQSSLFRIVLLFVLYLSLMVLVRLPFRTYVRELRFFLVMGTVIGISYYSTTSDLIQTCVAVLRFATIVLMSMLFTDTTAPDDLSRSVGSVLSRIPKVPGYRIGTTIELTIATIPLLFDITRQMSDSRRARLDRPYHRPIQRITSYVSAVFLVILDRAEDLEYALKGRGFDPEAPRQAPSLQKIDYIFLVIIIPFSIVLWIIT